MIDEIFSKTFAIIINNKRQRRTQTQQFVKNNRPVQTSSSVHSPALLFKSTSAFFNTMLENRRPIPLMAVMANMTLRLPSMFVLRIRRMCWNFSGMTKDWKTTNDNQRRDCLGIQRRPPVSQNVVVGRTAAGFHRTVEFHGVRANPFSVSFGFRGDSNG